MLNCNVMEADVIIVGSGAAGLCAAIAARKRGAKVLIISKSPIGMGNATAIASGTFRAALGGLTREEHYAETIRAGRGLCDPDLVSALVDEAPKRILELMERGAPLHMFKGGAEIEGHHTEPNPGKKISRMLAREAKRLGVDFCDKAMVLDLLVMKDRIAGIFGQASNSTAWLMGKAKAVVLATGGIGGLYQHSTNPRHTTGDGHALALRAGVILQDMEFVQFVPFGVVEPGLPRMVIPAEVMDHVPLVNSRGEEFLVSQFQSWGVTRPGEVNRYARDYGTRAIWCEVVEGRGHQGAVLLRLSSVAPEAWNIPEMVFFRKYILRGFPMDRDLHVAPLAHFTVGGISISPQGETNLEGLFAAGEVTGGLHGANRLGGNALSEALVFGTRVGLAAANYRSRVSFSNSADREAEHNVFRYENAPSNSGTLEIGHLKNKLRGAVEKYLGPIRCRDGLSTFLQEASEMNTLKRDVAVRTSQDRWGYWELENMLMVSEAVARSAVAREESRGAHYRKDYPEPVATFSSKHTFIHPGGVCQFLSSNAPTTDT